MCKVSRSLYFMGMTATVTVTPLVLNIPSLAGCLCACSATDQLIVLFFGKRIQGFWCWSSLTFGKLPPLGSCAKLLISRIKLSICLFFYFNWDINVSYWTFKHHIYRKPWIHHGPKSFVSNKSFSSLPHKWDLLRQGLWILPIDGPISARLTNSFWRSEVMKSLRSFLNEMLQWTCWLAHPIQCIWNKNSHCGKNVKGNSCSDICHSK